MSPSDFRSGGSSCQCNSRGRPPPAARLLRHHGDGRHRAAGTVARPAQEGPPGVRAERASARQPSGAQRAAQRLAQQRQLHHHPEGGVRGRGLLQLHLRRVSQGLAGGGHVRQRHRSVLLKPHQFHLCSSFHRDKLGLQREFVFLTISPMRQEVDG